MVAWTLPVVAILFVIILLLLVLVLVLGRRMYIEHGLISASSSLSSFSRRLVGDMWADWREKRSKVGWL